MTKRGMSVAEKIRKAQVAVVRRLNDYHIFLDQAIPVLAMAHNEYKRSASLTDRRYFVPSRTRRSVAKRTDAELKAIYDGFLNRDLFATTLIAAVSLLESFLFDSLGAVLRAYPRKLALTPRGEQGDRQVPLSVVVEAADLADVINAMVARRLQTASYVSPREYLTYLHVVAGVDTRDPAFDAYIEVKASRDLVVHNAGYVNESYLSKVGDSARGGLGDLLPIDQAYFDRSIAVLKRVATIVQRETWRTFAH